MVDGTRKIQINETLGIDKGNPKMNMREAVKRNTTETLNYGQKP